MKLPAKLNLARWIQQNAKDLKPPVSNKQLFMMRPTSIVFVSGGPKHAQRFSRQSHGGTLLSVEG